jgi:hypothetical protein
MKQFTLVISITFLCVSAFAQNKKSSKVKAPTTVSRNADNQVNHKLGGQEPDTLPKPRLEKRYTTVVKQKGKETWTGRLKANATPSVSEAPCAELTIETVETTMTISNINAAHTNIDVYKVRGDGSWTSVFVCNDNCGKQATVTVEPKKNYIVHVKMFDANWSKLCEKEITHATSGEPAEPEVQPSCDNVKVSVEGSTLSVANVKAPHSHTDIYKVRADGGWDTIFTCNDNCKESITVEADAKQKYVVHVKYFSEAWSMVCEKQIEYNPQ